MVSHVQARNVTISHSIFALPSGHIARYYTKEYWPNQDAALKQCNQYVLGRSWAVESGSTVRRHTSVAPISQSFQHVPLLRRYAQTMYLYVHTQNIEKPINEFAFCYIFPFVTVSDYLVDCFISTLNMKSYGALSFWFLIIFCLSSDNFTAMKCGHGHPLTFKFVWIAVGRQWPGSVMAFMRCKFSEIPSTKRSQCMTTFRRDPLFKC